MKKYIQQVLVALDETNQRGRLYRLDGVSGLSGDKVVGLLQRCAAIGEFQRPDLCYLEIGVFQGLTLTSVAHAAPSLSCYGIDNFAQFDPEKVNRSIVEARISKFCPKNAAVIDADFEEALMKFSGYSESRRIAVYFIDGPHDYRSQYLCLEFAKPWLYDEVLIVVDDANYEHVRRANCDWLRANPEFALLHEAYTPCHPQNMTQQQRSEAEFGWWNGVNVIVRDVGGSLERIYPMADRSRDRYFADHGVHPSKHALFAQELLAALNSNFLMAVARFCRLWGRARHSVSDDGDQFPTMNTRSEELPRARTAALLAPYATSHGVEKVL